MSDTTFSADQHIRAALNLLLEEETLRTAEFDREMAQLRNRIVSLQEAVTNDRPLTDIFNLEQQSASVAEATVPLLVEQILLPRRAATDVSLELIKRLKGLSQPEALIEIAQYHNGILKTAEAKQILIKAGLVKGNPKNVLSHLYSLLRSPERFQNFDSRLEKVSPGVFRLVPKNAELETADSESLPKQSTPLVSSLRQS